MDTAAQTPAVPQVRLLAPAGYQWAASTAAEEEAVVSPVFEP